MLHVNIIIILLTIIYCNIIILLMTKILMLINDDKLVLITHVIYAIIFFQKCMKLIILYLR